ncbi:MAG TPA: transglutaminase-like domain-containing protein [Opitutaceae bacterium]|nr:transglutaminase-like domain-containing protein [Opitutaceae bacterium]
MDPDQLSAPLQGAFRALLDDTTPVVRAALVSEFARRSALVVPFLQEIVRGQNRPLAWHAAWFLHELKFSDPVAEFKGFIRSLNYELETGSLLLSRIHAPELDVGACCATFDEIAARCRELMVEPSSARDKCRVLNRVLFHEYGFGGNVEHYADPLNSFIDEVLARRKGLPITLSIIYVLVAQRVGLTLEPVGLPGHFVVGSFLEATPFFIDPFEQGAFRTPAELFAVLRQHHLTPTISDLAPTPVREVLCRCCRNLSSHYAVARDELRARLYADLVEEFEATYERHTS